MKDFQGKVAVITGAASGIGKALAQKSVSEGLKVVLADREEHALYQTANQLGSAGGEVLPVVTDVSKPEAVEALAEKAFASYGAVHLLFNNAGVATGETLWESTVEDWTWVLGVNLGGVINGTRSFVPRLLKQNVEAHIINTASIAGLITSSTFGTYVVSKHAIVAFSESLALQLAQQNAPIKVSVLCPHAVDTPIATTTERHRPPALQNQRGRSEVATKAFTALEAMIRAGKSPAEIAEITFTALGEERFCIITHEETIPAIQLRTNDLITGHPPTPLD